MRHRSRPDQDQGGRRRRRQLPDHRAEDLHLRRRARSRPRTSCTWCSPASKARRRARRASRSSSCRSSCPTRTAIRATRNAVSCGSIEEKMGIHGNATCVMNYDGATGWLVGEREKGLRAMFTMMNEARLGVGVQGLALSEVAYQNAAIYARERRQGRSICRREGAGREGRSDHRASRRAPHADVDPRLQRGGARAGAVDGAEGRRRAPLRGRPPTAVAADDQMGLMTPVLKGVLTDTGFANAVRRSRSSAATATSPSTAWSSSCAMRASPCSTRARTASRRSTSSAASCRRTAGAR